MIYNQRSTSILMKKLILSLLLLLPFSSSLMAEEKVVNVYNWSDYIDDSVLKAFTEKTGIKVNYDVFDSNELLETKLLAGASGYDVVVPSAFMLERQIKVGIYQKLDKEKLPNLKNMWDVVAKRTAIYDPDNQYAVNYMWGTTGLGYVEEKIKERMEDAPVDSWDMIFKPEIVSKFADCGIYWLDTPNEMLPAAALYLGLDPANISKADLKKIEALVALVRPHIKKFHSSEYISALANGDICLAVGYSGDVFQAAARAEEANNGVTVKYSIPKEGAQMWFDQMAIPADAKHTEEAYTLLNYLMEPKVAATITNYVAYSNGNFAAQAFVDKEVIENKAIYPNETVMSRLYTISAFKGKMQRQVNRSWTRIKSGQ